MTGLAIALVLGAALIHAGWNYLLKKSGGGIGFVWAFAALSALFYAPLAAAVVYLQHFHFSATALAFILASAVLHTAYYLLLDRGYRYGDLSVVYPIARGSAPLLAVVIGIAVLGERLTGLQLAGVALLLGGILAVTLPQTSGRATFPALMTGVAIAAYTAVDRVGVRLTVPWVYGWMLVAVLAVLARLVWPRYIQPRAVY